MQAALCGTVDPEGNMNVWTKFQGNPSKIPEKPKNVNLIVVPEEK